MSSVNGGARQDERQSLEEQRQFLLESLRDLEREHDAGEIADDDYESWRADYTARAAAVLRALEPIRTDPPAAGGAPEAEEQTGEEVAGEEVAPSDVDGDGDGDDDEGDGDEPQRPARRRRTLATIAVVLVVALAGGVGVALFAGGKGSSPGLLDGTPAERLARAHQRETEGKAADAIRLYDSVIKSEPKNVEALTYRGWLLARAGLGNEALASLDQAIATDPSYPDAHFFRGVVIYRDRGDPAAAIPEFETFLAANPPPNLVEAVRGVIEQARQDLAQKNGASASTTTVPPPPPGG